LETHHHHQGEPEQQEQQPGDRVLDADDLVVHREHPLAQETQLFVMSVVVLMRMLVPVSRACGGRIQRQTPIGPGKGIWKSKRAIVCRRYKLVQASGGLSDIQFSSVKHLLALALVVLAAEPAAGNPASAALRAKGASEIYNLDRDRAVESFRQAVAADPRDAAAYRGLASALWLSITF